MEDSKEVSDPFMRTDERSVFNLVPPALQYAMIEGYKTEPDWFGLPQSVLLDKLRACNQKPNPTDNRLRMNFWREYEVSLEAGRNMKMEYVYIGVCDSTYFYKSYLKSPSKVAWLLTAPASYTLVTEEALLVGLDTLRKILDQDPFNKDGSPNTKLMEIQTKIVAMLDTRVKGAVVQKTMNIHSTVTDKKLLDITQTKSVEDLQTRLKALEQRRKQHIKATASINDPGTVTVEQGDNAPEPAPRPIP